MTSIIKAKEKDGYYGVFPYNYIEFSYSQWLLLDMGVLIHIYFVKNFIYLTPTRRLTMITFFL